MLVYTRANNEPVLHSYDVVLMRIAHSSKTQDVYKYIHTRVCLGKAHIVYVWDYTPTFAMLIPWHAYANSITIEPSEYNALYAATKISISVCLCSWGTCMHNECSGGKKRCNAHGLRVHVFVYIVLWKRDFRLLSRAIFWALTKYAKTECWVFTLVHFILMIFNVYSAVLCYMIIIDWSNKLRMILWQINTSLKKTFTKEKNPW